VPLDSDSIVINYSMELDPVYEALKTSITSKLTRTQKLACKAEEAKFLANEITRDELMLHLVSFNSVVQDKLDANLDGNDREAPTATMMSQLTAALSNLGRTQHIESFGGSKDEQVEQWMRKFEITAQINSWDRSASMMRAQFELHMKGSAALWFATEQEVLNNCQWREVKNIFLSRFRPSLQSMAMDLSRMYQRADETVKQFGERFCRAQANFPDKCEEVKLVEFMDKLQPKFQTIMATHIFRSLTEAIDSAIILEERAELKLRKEEEIERIVAERMLALQRKEPNNFSQRHTQLSSHGPNRAVRQVGQQNHQQRQQQQQQQRQQQPQRELQGSNGNWRDQQAHVQPQASQQQQRGNQGPDQHDTGGPSNNNCFKCGEPGHYAAACPQTTRRVFMMNSATTPENAPTRFRPSMHTRNSDTVVLQQRPAGRSGFDVSTSAVQRPSPRAVPRRSCPPDVLSEATISMPLSKFVKLEGMAAKIQSVARTTDMAAMATPVVTCGRDRATEYTMMQLIPGHVSLNSVPCKSTVLDTGASLSMISTSFATACGVIDSATSASIKYLTADGSVAAIDKILKGTHLKVGRMVFEVDLALTDSGAFDLLLGVDFMDTSKTIIDIKGKVLQMTSDGDGQDSIPVPFTITAADQETHSALPTVFFIVPAPEDSNTPGLCLATPQGPTATNSHENQDTSARGLADSGLGVPSLGERTSLDDLQVDQSELQILPKLFFTYNAQFGPFDRDAACDIAGSNALVPRYWTRADDLTIQDWAHQNIWCNVPFHLAYQAMTQFLKGKSASPEDTAATFVIPALPDSAAWKLASEHFQLVDYHPAFSEVFTATPAKAGEARRAVGPSKIPMAVITCPAGAIIHNHSSFQDLPAMEPTFSKEALEQLHLPEHLPEKTATEFRDLFRLHADVFATSTEELGRCTIGVHTIDTGDAKPIKQKAYRCSQPENDFLERTITELEQQGIVEPSQSAWASPVVVVPKKDGGKRICVDLRKVNMATRGDSFPMPNAEDLIDDLESAKVFSTLDLLSGFHQIAMEPGDKEKTAFITKKGLYQFTRMPFGLKNAPATFQRIMEAILVGLPFVKCFIDDIIIYSCSFKEHMRHLDIVFTRLRNVNMKVKAKKCYFAMKEVKYLGHIITADGIKPNDERVEVIHNMQQPVTLTEVRSFLGVTGYYRKFIKNYAAIAEPLTNLTRHSVASVRAAWGEEHTAAFDKLRLALTEEPILTRPDLSRPFILTTDWQPTSIAGILSQKNDAGLEQVIAYGSKKLSGPEANWSATEGECWAAVYFTKKWRHFLLNGKFTLITDHAALKYIMTATDSSSKWQRWALKIRAFDFDVKHRPGKENVNADGLSRLQYNTPLSMANTATVMMMSLVDNDSGITPAAATAATSTITSAATPTTPSEVTSMATSSAPSTAENNDAPVIDMVADDPLPGESDGSQICAACKKSNPEEELLQCTGCNKSFHRISCVQPSVYEELDEWTCHDCGGEMNCPRSMKSITDITLDQPVLDFLRHNEMPADCSPKETLRIRKRAKSYLFRDGKLYKDKDGKHRERIVPTIVERTAIAKQIHYLGHPKQNRLRRLILQNHYWPGTDQTAKQVCDNCPTCQSASQGGIIPREIRPIPVYGALERWHLDLIGPFPTSSSGNKYIVVAVDSVTKWPEAAAITHKTADQIKVWFWEAIICRYGTPQEVITDNGAEFKGGFAALLQKCDVTHHLTSPHHPQANGLVERMNQTVKNSLKRDANSAGNNWDRKLSLILLGIRAAHQATIKMPPCEALYGHRIRLPVIAEAYISNDILDDGTQSAAAFAAQTVRQQHMQHIEDLALRNIEHAAERVVQHSIRKAAKRKTPNLPDVGDLVLVRNFTHGALQQAWEANVYRCGGYNTTQTQMTVTDAKGLQWRENIENCKLYQGGQD
jgi:predicted aspartyl protease